MGERVDEAQLASDITTLRALIDSFLDEEIAPDHPALAAASLVLSDKLAQRADLSGRDQSRRS
jgi:hypothetical protein